MTNQTKLTVVGSGRRARLATMLLLVAALVLGSLYQPPHVAAAPTGPAPPTVEPPQQWDPGGTTYADNQRVEEPEALRFAEFWTAMFLGSQFATPAFGADLRQIGLDAHVSPEGISASEPLLQAYLDSDAAADGLFGHYNERQKKYLVVYLVNHWRRFVPGFAATMATAPRDPKVMDDLELANMLSMVAFDKQGLKQQLASRYGGDQGGVPAPAGAPAAPATALAEAEALVASRLGGRPLPPAPVLPNLPALNTTPPDLLGAADTAVDLVDDLRADVPTVEDVKDLVDSLHFRPCWRRPGQAETCGPQHPIGDPVGARVDLVPGGLPEAFVSVIPDPFAPVGGAGTKLTLRSTSSAAQPGEVYVKYRVSQANGQVTAGFDGMPASGRLVGLTQTASVALESLSAAASGDLRLKASLGHDAATTITSTLVGGFAPSSGTPMGAKVRFDPAPSSFTARLRIVQTTNDQLVEASLDAGNQPRVTATVVQKDSTGTRSSQAVVDRLPATARVTIDPDIPLVTYDASARIGSVSASRTERDASGAVGRSISASVTDVPARWSVRAAKGQPLVVTYSASDRIGNITGSVVDKGLEVAARGRIAGFPKGEVKLDLNTDTGVLNYNAAETIGTVDFSVEQGEKAALADAGSLPLVHGLAVRDGRSGSEEAVKARLYLTGLPRSASFRPGGFAMKGFTPAVGEVRADIDLDAIVATPVRALAALTVPANLPLDLDFSTSSQPLAPTGAEHRAKLVANRGVGPLHVEVESGTTGASLQVSNIPSHVDATLTELEGQTKVVWRSAPINSVRADFRAVKASTDTDLQARGFVELKSIPGNFDLVLGRDGTGTGPVLTYTGGADTLDVVAHADGSLAKPNSTLKANLDFAITDLARSTRVFVEGTKLRLTTGVNPFTGVASAVGRIFAKVSAAYEYDKEGEDVLNEGSWLSFPYKYRVHFGARVDNLRVVLDGVRDFVLEPGVASRISGTFTNFEFRWDRIPVNYDVYGEFRMRIDWPSPLGVSTVTLAKGGADGAFDIEVDFHKYTSAKGPWIGASASVAWCDLRLTTALQPNPRGVERNGFRVPQPASGTSWLVIPNPFGLVPDAIVDLVALGVVSPSDFDMGFDLDC